MTSKQGWILRIQKFRERIDLWLLYANLLLNVLYHIEIEMKIRESCLQTGNFIYKPGISLTKQDFHLQRGSLGLQRGFSGYYLPNISLYDTNVNINLLIFDKFILNSSIRKAPGTIFFCARSFFQKLFRFLVIILL